MAGDAKQSPLGDAIRRRAELSGVGNLREHTARGTLVNAAYFIGLYSLGLLKGFIVAAFLTRADYGIWGILVIGLGTFLWLKQVGIGDKYVQQDEEDQELAFQKAFTLELTFSGIFLLVLFAAVPVLALVYGQPELLLPGFVACLTVAGGALQTPFWVFYRRMDFVRQRTLQAVDPVVGFVVTVALAVAGAGYWALVLGVVAGSLSGAVVAIRHAPYKLRFRWEKGALRTYAGFSWPLFVAGGSSMIIAQSSILVGTKALGLAAVGSIALASSISDYTNKVDQVVTQTLYPAICAVKDRTDLLFESFVKSNRLALMWGLPFGVGIAVFASDLVTYGIGEHWRPAVGTIAAFGLIAALGHIGFNWDAFYRARGNTRPIAVWSFITMLAFVAFAIPLMLWKGLNGFAVGMGIMALVSLIVRGIYLMRLFDGLQMLRHAARAIAPTLPAVAAVYGVRALVGDDSLPMALAQLALYVAVTIAATWAFERPLLREVMGYLRGRKSTAAPVPA
jgi:O-antigen/teichoic acid export membrane protein